MRHMGGVECDKAGRAGRYVLSSSSRVREETPRVFFYFCTNSFHSRGFSGLLKREQSSAAKGQSTLCACAPCYVRKPKNVK